MTKTSSSRSIPTSTARSGPILLAVDQKLSEDACLGFDQYVESTSSRIHCIR
jgi:hypothetical protein